MIHVAPVRAAKTFSFYPQSGERGREPVPSEYTYARLPQPRLLRQSATINQAAAPQAHEAAHARAPGHARPETTARTAANRAVRATHAHISTLQALLRAIPSCPLPAPTRACGCERFFLWWFSGSSLHSVFSFIMRWRRPPRVVLLPRITRSDSRRASRRRGRPRTPRASAQTARPWRAPSYRRRR